MHVDHNMLSIADSCSYHPWGFPQCPRGRFGPFRGRGGCSSGGRFGGHPYPGGLGGQGFIPPWWQGFGRGGASCQGNQCGGKAEKDKGEGQEPMDTEQRPGPSEEERKTFLRGVGEAVSSFLEPFGVKVDVDVLGGEKPGDSKTTTSDTPAAPDVRIHSKFVMSQKYILSLLTLTTSLPTCITRPTLYTTANCSGWYLSIAASWLV